MADERFLILACKGAHELARQHATNMFNCAWGWLSEYGPWIQELKAHAKDLVEKGEAEVLGDQIEYTKHLDFYLRMLLAHRKQIEALVDMEEA